MKKVLLMLLSLSFAVHADSEMANGQPLDRQALDLQTIEVQALDWQVLAPTINEQDVSLPEVTESQKRLLATVIQLQDSAKAVDIENAVKARQRLLDEGVDVDAALDARARYMSLAQRRAESLNSEVNGKHVSMSGFVVPTKFNGVKATEFLLLPYAGACIHMPPPAANQIVKLSYPPGFEVENVQFPVTVRGTINAGKQTELVQLVDGKMNVTMGYAMDALTIEKYYTDTMEATQQRDHKEHHKGHAH
ncbi:DUF3299 domain-containing protein [Shewanella sp. Isolate13]|uniref:DUF3299 domain-containing protein n=1 Tax=Shewanella sp. Isolate13 TaxID=2908531 RepID=UPI001EFD2652|nr:DUF3299 domain-containing protein [Shewanella sp. Isolate13]MCG9728774.1 DUF3299 domain-containing protein [Shewanella sp. Isolate13]